ncbi:fibronectin type III domain-containing protein [Dactylosporangium sp. AC04546]|uniref:fibronectin type III domain-containing protein n=1 Tax=Dactylosporangium sp. AC04546 TaxID=2862460 RepID=UPI001EDDAF1E|nr:fibronectin type III domain-containing protein [Dactylosporangium sp. AC04546]WVK89045.1 fibronectin type III domain-containing protein [Dactylosporangium sp. AC04546]
MSTDDDPEFPPFPPSSPSLPGRPPQTAAPEPRPAAGPVPDLDFDGADSWDEHPPARRTWPLIVAVVAALVVMLLLATGAFDGPSGTPPGPRPSGSPGAVLSSGAGARPGTPGDVRLRDEGATVTVTWTDRTAGTAQHAVLSGPRDGAATVRRLLAPGTTTLVLRGLDPRQDYCFQVLAIIGTDDYARADPVCTKRS